MSKKVIPAYKMITDNIKERILVGELTDGYKFPSFRDMADEYNVSRNTIAQAMDILLANGYVKKNSDKSFLVTNNKQISHNINWNNFLKQTKPNNNVISYGMHKTRLHSSLMAKHDSMYFNAIKQAITNIDRFSLKDYRGEKGTIDLITKYLCTQHHINVSSENILIVPNISLAQHIVCKIVASANTKFITARLCPFYINTFTAPDYVQLLKTHSDDEGYILGDIKRVTSENSHSNNILYFETVKWLSGVKTTNKRIEEIYNYCVDNNIPIIENNAISDLYFGEEQFTSMKSISEGSNVIYISSIASSVNPLDHLAYIVAPTYMVKLISEVLEYISWSNSNTMQLVISEMLKDGSYNAITNETKPKLRTRHAQVDDIIKHYLPPEILRVDKATAGLFKTITFDESIITNDMFSGLKTIPYVKHGDKLSLCITANDIDDVEKFIKNIAHSIKVNYE